MIEIVWMAENNRRTDTANLTSLTDRKYFRQKILTIEIIWTIQNMPVAIMNVFSCFVNFFPLKKLIETDLKQIIITRFHARHPARNNVLPEKNKRVMILPNPCKNRNRITFWKRSQVTRTCKIPCHIFVVEEEKA